ncbi:IclR family transcriptional regulator [Rhodococcus koreensis]|uniref:IclR family transcriptional regulator n=1 Tax=Rhodococcus koreensis TaxID=99653 RepID=UPI00366BC60D
MSDHYSRGAAGTTPLLVLSKITAILDAFTLTQPVMTSSEIHRRTGIPESTVRRLVANMTDVGFLDHTPDGVQIGAQMASWAVHTKRSRDILSAVRPVLAELRDVPHETVSFVREERGLRVCLAVAETRHSLRREMYVGKLLPLEGASGRIIADYSRDHLEDSVAPSQTTAGPTIGATGASADEHPTGYAITIDEIGIAEIAAPVFGSTADLLGVISISGPRLRMSLHQCHHWSDLLVHRAEHLTRTMGGTLPVRTAPQHPPAIGTGTGTGTASRLS